MRCRAGLRMGVLAVIALGHAAWADRAAAQRLAAEADRTHDPATYVACGQAFLDIYNHDPEAKDADEVVFDAARCFQAGKSISAALQGDGLVIKSFPRSKLAAKSIALSGEMYAQIAMYDRAAERFEDYAKRYAGEKDAADFLTEAIRFRAALGDKPKQIEDTKEWIRMFGVKRRAEAAAADLSLVPVYDGDGAIAQLHEFLKDFATVDPNLTIAAHVDLADRLRAKSCPLRAAEQAIRGLCVKLVAVRGPHCGTGTTNVTAVTRTAQNHEAREEYAAAVALADRATEPAARHAQAMARLGLADDDLEAMLAMPFPRDVDMARLASRNRIGQWADAEVKLAAKLDRALGDVIVQKDPTSSVAAAARSGEAAQTFWRALMLGELPKAMRREPDRASYCDSTKSVADPLRDRAIEAAQFCIAKAVELQAGQDWANACWRDGAALDPLQFAPVGELRGTPGEFAPPITLEPATR